MARTSPSRTRVLGLALILAVLFFVTAILLAGKPAPAQAASLPPAPAPQTGQPTNEVCLACHSRPDQAIELASGEMLDIHVNPELFASSMHGQEGLSCTQCHTDITGYPHPPIETKSSKEYTLQYQQTCKNCHQQEFEANQDGIHAQLLAGGNLNSPTCSNCHDPHTQTRLTDEQGNLLPDARAWVAETCAQCHNAIFEQYKISVHGSGVLDANNPDVPTCTDCHGVHSIGDPTTAEFRVNSPKICSDCHTDETIMSKYSLSTNVLSTYVADFHGTTVTLFQKQHPDQETNKPVCFDCHGVHNIPRVNDPQHGIAIKGNLLVTCQKCHPDANMNFPDSWLSHYDPTPQKFALVYWVNMFYKILIPLVLGAMAIFVLSDIYRRFIRRGKKAPTSTPPTQES